MGTFKVLCMHQGMDGHNLYHSKYNKLYFHFPFLITPLKYGCHVRSHVSGHGEAPFISTPNIMSIIINFFPFWIMPLKHYGSHVRSW